MNLSLFYLLSNFPKSLSSKPISHQKLSQIKALFNAHLHKYEKYTSKNPIHSNTIYIYFRILQVVPYSIL
jgi:hypothetical protein